MLRNDPESIATYADRIELNRILAVGYGVWAQAVCTHAEQATAQWLAAPPPLAVVQLAGDLEAQTVTASAQEVLAAARELLASLDQKDTLARHGYAIGRPDELHLWVVTSVEPGEAAAAGPSAGRQAPDWPALAGQVAGLGAEVWRRQRVRVILHALFLGPPLAQAELARGARVLAAAGIPDLYIAGPVNQMHECVEESAWLPAAALALAALWWGAWPSYAIGSGAGTVHAVGASAWPSSVEAVRRWLLVRNVAEVATQLLAAPGAPELPADVAELGDSLCHALEEPRRMVAELGGAVPEPANGQVRRFSQPSWHDLADLPQRVAAAMRRLDEQERVTTRQARNHWLDNWIDRWSSWRAVMEVAALRPPAGNPVLPSHRRDLANLDAVVHECLATIDTALELCSKDLQAAEAATAAAQARLAHVCAGFPTYGAMGILGACLQPWRWPGWALDYYRALPDRLAALETAEERRRTLTWHEANWHVLRQLALSIQQQVHRELAAAAQLEERLGGLAEWAHDEHAQSGADDLAPWAPATLEALWAKTCAAGILHRLAAALAARPLTTWPDCSTSELGEALYAALAGAPVPLGDWVALDCLVRGLDAAEEPRPAEAAPGVELSRWLSAQVRRAAPLWPRLATSGIHPESCWLLLPASSVWSRRSPEEPVEDATERVAGWAQRGRNPIAIGACAGDALVCMRWHDILITDLELDADG